MSAEPVRRMLPHREHRRAYAGGYRARVAGDSESANPFPTTPDYRQAWVWGYREGRECELCEGSGKGSWPGGYGDACEACTGFACQQQGSML